MSDDWLTVLHGDCRDVLPTLPDESVHCVVTSPPYWGLRDYGTASWDGGDADCDHKMRPDGGPKQLTSAGAAGHVHRDCKCGATRIYRQIGLEPTPEEYVATMVGVFREVRRVLRRDGTLWLNLGDSYAGGGTMGRNDQGRRVSDGAMLDGWKSTPNMGTRPAAPGLKPKDLVGIPWRVAFALQADGWYLRSDIIWSKPNPMPESVTDRPTKSHEYLFLLTRSERYHYDADAIREDSDWGRVNNPDWQYQRAATNERKHPTNRNGKSAGFAEWQPESGRNRRSVWTIATAPYPGAHFATFPPKLVEPCILAGCPEKVCAECGAPWEHIVERETNWKERRAAGAWAGNVGVSETYQNGVHGSGMSDDLGGGEVRYLGYRDSCGHAADTTHGVVLDPFAGTGTVGMVAQKLSRRAVLIDLNGDYLDQLRTRNAQTPLGLTA